MSEWTDERLVAVEELTLTTRYPRRVGRNARLGHHGTGPAVRAVVLRTGAGATGWGLVPGRGALPSTLAGRRVAELFDPATGVLDPAAAPLDIALHDLAGTLLQRPVHSLLGGRGALRLEVYDGAIYFDDLDPDEAPRGVDAVLAECAADHRLGYRAFKLKIGRGHRWLDPEAGLRRDIEITRAVRAAYPDARLLVDANDGYTVETALRYLSAVADCAVYWLEEPFAENAGDLRRLRDGLADLPAAPLVADGEFEPDLDHVLALAGEGLIDVALMDVLDFGLTRWRAVAPRLRQLGVRASPHAWGVPLKTLYAAQLAAGLGNVDVVEGVPGVVEGVDVSAYRFDEGVLQLPDAPGFGLPVPVR